MKYLILFIFFIGCGSIKTPIDVEKIDMDCKVGIGDPPGSLSNQLHISGENIFSERHEEWINKYGTVVEQLIELLGKEELKDYLIEVNGVIQFRNPPYSLDWFINMSAPTDYIIVYNGHVSIIERDPNYDYHKLGKGCTDPVHHFLLSCPTPNAVLNIIYEKAVVEK